MVNAKSSKVNSLLAAIKQNVPTTTKEEEPAPANELQATPPPSRKAARPIAAMTKSRIGKPVQFWLHDEDRKLVRELAAWLAGQGMRPTDSMVIRSALRTAKTGGEFLSAYRQAAQLDGRLKQHKAK